MTNDHFRNALIIVFILNVATLAQNFRYGQHMDEMAVARDIESARWEARWVRLVTILDRTDPKLPSCLIPAPRGDQK